MRLIAKKSLPLILISITASSAEKCSKSNPCPSGQFCNFDYGLEEGGFCESCNHIGNCAMTGFITRFGYTECCDICSLPGCDYKPCSKSKSYHIACGHMEICAPPSWAVSLSLEDDGKDWGYCIRAPYVG